MDLSAGSVDLVGVGACRLNVWSAGEAGPAVLLIHGVPTNHRLWRDVVPGLRARRVLAVDMVGFGDSDAGRDLRVDLASQASALVGLLDTLGLDRVVVVGHDLGGGAAQILATTSADRVAALGIVNGSATTGGPCRWSAP